MTPFHARLICEDLEIRERLDAVIEMKLCDEDEELDDLILAYNVLLDLAYKQDT